MMIIPFNLDGLMQVPKREADEEITKVRQVFVIPRRRKHISGKCCMDMVAERWNHGLIRFAGGRDEIKLEGSGFKVSFPAQQLMVISNKEPFTISDDLGPLKFSVEEEEIL